MAERGEGTFQDVRRSWESAESGSQVGCYLAVQGRVSLAALLAYLGEVAPDRTPDQFGINFATVTWTDAPTEEETQQRVRRKALHDERRAEWERTTYEELKAKFEGGDQPG
jgi:hypothetical protein